MDGRSTDVRGAGVRRPERLSALPAWPSDADYNEQEGDHVRDAPAVCIRHNHQRAQALRSELDIGLLLPCNVIVYAADNEGRSVVQVMDPVAALALTGDDAIKPLSDDVKARLQRVLEAVSR